MLHYLVGLAIFLPLMLLNLSTPILILGGRKLGPRMIYESSLYPILPHNSQSVFF